MFSVVYSGTWSSKTISRLCSEIVVSVDDTHDDGTCTLFLASQQYETQCINREDDEFVSPKLSVGDDTCNIPIANGKCSSEEEILLMASQ